MTTATSDKVDLTAASNGQAQPAKRRGRPPGSKNKVKAEGTPKRGRPRKSTARKTTTRKTTARRVNPQPVQPTAAVENHAILIENDGLVVIGNDGSSYRINAPVIVDRRNA